MDAPERIWAWTWTGKINSGQWSAILQPNETEYVRADLMAAQPQEARSMIRRLSDTLELRLEEAVTYDECMADINSARAFIAK
jgi:hypothetical protein